MAKEKTEFEILANTLKAMNKQCTAKVKGNRAALTAIFVSFKTQLAYASDGHRLAILDLNGHMDHKEIEELAFYADMQAIEYANGFALISAKKKEFFIKNCGQGMLDTLDPNQTFDYPNVEAILPKAEGLQHVSETGAVFIPSGLNAIDKVVTAMEQNTSNSVAIRLYGKKDKKGRPGLHLAFYSRLIVGLVPLHIPEENLEEIPTNTDYYNAIRFAPDKDPEEHKSGLEVTKNKESTEDENED
jgi:hypothetical protein